MGKKEKKKNYDNIDLEFFCSMFVIILTRQSIGIAERIFYSNFMIDVDMKQPSMI
jgi:hypothetical protein